MNSICSSAFVLLLMDPWQLFDVGFQLSYLAVGGIVLLQKKIYECLYLRNTWVDKAWQLTSVSVAAQLATFPLCLYYFHQFPNWFILSNLLIIPVSTVLLYSIIIFFAFHWIPGIGVMLANISSSLATIMNASVRALSELPGAVSRGIWISAGQTALLYGVLICLVVWWYTRTARYFVVGLFLMGLFATWTCGDWHRNLSTKEIVFHCVNNRTAITCTLGNESAFMYSGKWKEDSISFAFRLAPHWDRLRPNVHFVSLDSTHAPLPWLQRGDGFLNAAGKVVLLADTLVGATWMASSVVHGQVVLVTQNAVRHRDWNHFESCTIVFDNTCSPGYIAKAMGPLQEGRNSVFDLHAGAVTISLADDGVKQVSM